MRILRVLVRGKGGPALAVVGIALAFLPMGLEAVGYNLSPQQGYGVLVAAGLLIWIALLVFVWPWISEAWLWIRRDAQIREAQEAQQRLREKLHEVEQECEKLRKDNEKLAQSQNDRRRDLIKTWRDYFDNYDYVGGNIRETGTYSSIRPHLSQEILERLENPRELHIEVDNRTGGDLTVRGQSPSSVKTLLLDEVTRLEQEWSLL